VWTKVEWLANFKEEYYSGVGTLNGDPISLVLNELGEDI
jgi:hypothetical protein